ncbi:acetyl-CoA carboxylase biotin carboxyl carrier protein [Hwanghaeella grinnelliae]|uniref:Biotin carboxyl carrier protein of acetyl-CoA carboxylase n=1 Tax=Hwanghaeella grinnelliae TaxID=2500179 RepID=A0A3S2WD86_9PROT|nr:acetyl-CoA carboxylase biotin carboxyl carrier protein [Hwanghaeella grinnelliae]
MTVDTDLVDVLADLMEKKGLTEVEVTVGDQTLRLSKGGTAPAVTHMAAPVAAAPAPAAAPAAPAEHPGAIKSPMVGTIYLSPQPGNPAFISVGDTVTEGQTLLIVEAMKVMNPIPAPRAGKVTAILVDDAEPVEFDQPLVVLE